MRRDECAAVTRRARGFTLLEVLVALLLLALALVALVRTASLEARALAQLQDSTLGQWVASNAIAELRLRAPRPQPGRRDGHEMLGGRRWEWRMTIEPTTDSGMLRIDVEVFAAEPRGGRRRDPDPVAVLSGFAGR